jgi:hypothetical protein
MPPAPRKSTAQKAGATTRTVEPKTTQEVPATKVAAKPTTALPEPRATTTTSVGAAASGAAARAQVGAEDAVVRIGELQAQLLESARREGAAYLQAYEGNLSTMVGLTESAAESTQLSWAVTLANGYADMVTRVNDAVIRAGRKSLG